MADSDTVCEFTDRRHREFTAARGGREVVALRLADVDTREAGGGDLDKLGAECPLGSAMMLAPIPLDARRVATSAVNESGEGGV